MQRGDAILGSSTLLHSHSQYGPFEEGDGQSAGRSEDMDQKQEQKTSDRGRDKKWANKVNVSGIRNGAH